MGAPAGERQPDGVYPGGTVNDLVSRRLKEMAEKLAKYQGEEKRAAS